MLLQTSLRSLHSPEHCAWLDKLHIDCERIYVWKTAADRAASLYELVCDLRFVGLASQIWSVLLSLIPPT